MGMLADDIAFHSNIPVAADLTVAVVYAVFGVCSLLGNSTLLYVCYKKKHLLKPAEFFIINLAVSDMGLTLSLYPMAITSSIYHRWLFGKTVCLIYAFCGMLFGLCSLTTLTVLSMVCFVKVCCPFYGNRFNPVHGRLLIACAWLYALFFACSPLVHWGEYGPEPYGTACCIDWQVSNRQSMARSYTLVLIVFCYIVPCCVIVASYTGILVTVRASQKAMEQHKSRPTHMSNVQTIIVKLSVAVCIGFFAAWSPYAMVSMWAAFGHIENIPPLAFAIPAMFAKSSTIYNPVIYLLLRPNFRRVMCRDLGSLRRACLQRCFCSQGPRRARGSKPVVRLRLRSLRRHTGQSCSTDSSGRPALASSQGCRVCDKRGDAFECFRHYPRVCCTASQPGNAIPPLDQTPPDNPLPQMQAGQKPQQRDYHKKSLRATMRGKRTSEIDNLQINLEMVPGHAKIAWP